MPTFGDTFQPYGGDRHAGGGPGAVEPVQEAIRVLSFRPPRVMGGRPIAPLGLLNALGSQGQSQGALAQTQGVNFSNPQLLQALLQLAGMGAPGGWPGGGGPSGSPSGSGSFSMPHITPGVSGPPGGAPVYAPPPPYTPPYNPGWTQSGPLTNTETGQTIPYQSPWGT